MRTENGAETKSDDVADASGDLVVVGLGNPGDDYARSRHNLGVRVVSEVAARLEVAVDRRRWRSLVGIGTRPGSEGRLWVVLPQTYMNESGRAVRAALKDTGLEASNLWLVHDELDLPFCRLRIRRGGSAAGHNGLRSIIGALGTEDFVRFRIGVGKPPSAAVGANYVLGGFSRREQPLVSDVVRGSADAVEKALRAGLDTAMGIYNRAGALGCKELE
jgi:PTH1 family peptidyl-tRNA hydrolase